MATVLLCLLALANPAPSVRAETPRAALPSLDEAARRHGSAIVGVWVGATMSSGFFVSSSGVAVTVLRPGGAGDVVVELGSGERRKGRVLARDEDGLALVEVDKLDKDVVFAALGLGTAAIPKVDAWLLALSFVDGRAAPSLGGMRRVDEGGRWRLDLPVDAGAPVLVGGRVIGVVMRRADPTSSVAVPVARVTALAKRIPAL